MAPLSSRGARAHRRADSWPRCRRIGVTVSMSRRGNCWDNAVAESFFSTLKRELIERVRWSGPLALRDAVFEYIEVFYNRRRLNSALGYAFPAQVESDYALQLAA